MDKISVIAPVYNVEPYLRKALDSIINQTYKNLEIILVDDGSPDNCGKICDEYALKDNRIKVLHIKNGGPAVARNTGLDIATGDFIGFIDPDDYFELDMYEILHNAITRTKAGLAVCNWYKGTENNWEKYSLFPSKEILTPNEAFEAFYNCMYVWNKLYRKEVVGNLRQIETYAQDVYYTFTTLTRRDKVVCVDKCLCYYRMNPTSRQHTKKFKKNFLEFLKVSDMEMEYAETNKLLNLKDKLYNFRMNKTFLWVKFIALEDKPDTESAKLLLEDLKKNGFSFFKTKMSFKRRCFIFLCFINFNLVSFFYKLMLKFKNKNRTQ